MEGNIQLKISCVFDNESSELFKEEVRKIVKDIIKEEIAKAVKDMPIPYYPVYPVYPTYPMSPIYTTNQPPIQEYVTITCDCTASIADCGNKIIESLKNSSKKCGCSY